jgi:hypothetical protein
MTLAVRILLCPADNDVGDPENEEMVILVVVVVFEAVPVLAPLPQAIIHVINVREISSPNSRNNFAFVDFIMLLSF